MFYFLRKKNKIGSRAYLKNREEFLKLTNVIYSDEEYSCDYGRV